MQSVLTTLVHLIGWPLMLIGCVFIIVGAVGLVRMPDLYTRLHAGGVTDTGGAIFLLLPLILYAAFVMHLYIVAVKLLLILFFTLFTTPTASHALAKTALLFGQVPTDKEGKPILESPEEAQMLARSRAES